MLTKNGIIDKLYFLGCNKKYLPNALPYYKVLYNWVFLCCSEFEQADKKSSGSSTEVDTF